MTEPSASEKPEGMKREAQYSRSAALMEAPSATSRWGHLLIRSGLGTRAGGSEGEGAEGWEAEQEHEAQVKADARSFRT